MHVSINELTRTATSRAETPSDTGPPNTCVEGAAQRLATFTSPAASGMATAPSLSGNKYQIWGNQGAAMCYLSPKGPIKGTKALSRLQPAK